MPAYIPLLPLAAALLTGCAHNPKAPLSAKGHYEKALKQKEGGKPAQALETLQELRKNFVYSPYARPARLLTADIHFAMENYQQALEGYQSFQKIYPSVQAAYVLYQLGQSAARQLPDRPDLDLSIGDLAIKYFQALLNLPSGAGDYKKKAADGIKAIRLMKAEKEFKTAAFYKRRGWKKASLKRFGELIERYPESPLLPQALLHGFQLAEDLGQPSDSFKKRLLKGFPGSKEARSL